MPDQNEQRPYKRDNAKGQPARPSRWRRKEPFRPGRGQEAYRERNQKETPHWVAGHIEHGQHRIKEFVNRRRGAHRV